MKKLLALASLLILAGPLFADARIAGSAPSFARARNYGTGPDPESVAIGDLNGDGKADLATANNGSVSVLLNEGDGRFEPKRSYVTGERSGSIVVGDLNGDGKPDLAASNWEHGIVFVLLNRGDGTFQAKRDYAVGGGVEAVAIGDLNGDGALDLATVGNAVSLLLNRGDGSFEAKLVYRTAHSHSALAIGDLNGDGKSDLVVTNAHSVSVLLNSGGADFRARREYRTAQDPEAVAIGDVNGDGKPDLATANIEIDASHATVSVLVNQNGGRFGARRDYKVRGNPTLRSPGGDPVSVAIADLNRDGKPDVATADSAEVEVGTVSVFVNRGGGRLRPELVYGPVGLDSVAVAIGDLDGDAKPDVVAANNDSGSVSVLFNRPGLCTVQGVWRRPLPAARRTLARANCRVGAIRRVASGVESGRVIWQKPGFGAVLPGGSKVDLVVSRGKRTS